MSSRRVSCPSLLSKFNLNDEFFYRVYWKEHRYSSNKILKHIYIFQTINHKK